MKQVLVTGGTGNLGKSVIECLRQKNVDISALTSRPNISLPDDITMVKGDLAAIIRLLPAASECLAMGVQKSYRTSFRPIT